MTDSSNSPKSKDKPTLHASVEGIVLVKDAITRLGYNSQTEFAKLNRIGRSTVSNLTNGRPVEILTFKKICEILELDWKKVAFIEKKEIFSTVNPSDLSSDEWVGREAELEQIQNMVNRNKVIAIYGKGGVGKTTLAEKVIVDICGFEQSDILEFKLANDIEQVEQIENIIDNWLQLKFKQKPSKNFSSKLEQLKLLLQEKRVGILIDNIEVILDDTGSFISSHRSIIEFFRALNSNTVQSLTLITSREKICESGVSIEPFFLKGLAYNSWEVFFCTRNIEINEAILREIYEAYGGNTKAMRIISASVTRNSLNSYWQENKNEILYSELELKDLVSTQMDTLQSKNYLAYSLLCRLGYHKYQDIPRIKESNVLNLLWDTPLEGRKIVLTSLINTDLLEMKNGEYWLHPIIKLEALTRSEFKDDLKRTNYKIGEFYFKSVSDSEDINQTKYAFEAFHHFYEAKDFSCCSKTLLYKILGAKELELDNLRYSANIWRYTSRILLLGKSIITNLDGQDRMLNLIPIGVCSSDLGENLKALEISKEILDLSENLNDLDEVVIFAKTMSYSIAGRANRLIGKFDEALASCELATKIAHSSKNDQTKALALYELGRAYIDKGNPARAFPCIIGAAFRAIGMKIPKAIYEFSGRLFDPINKTNEKVAKILDRYDQSDKLVSYNIKKFRIIYSLAQCFNLMYIPLIKSFPLAKSFIEKSLDIGG